MSVGIDRQICPRESSSDSKLRLEEQSCQSISYTHYRLFFLHMCLKAAGSIFITVNISYLKTYFHVY